MNPGSRHALAERARRLRRFNRFYTQRLGVLQRAYLGTRFSLTEARVLYELGQGAGPTASDLAGRLGLDAGYLSRLLAEFERERLLARPRSRRDRRRRPLRLTPAGRRAFRGLDLRSQRDAEATLLSLPGHRQDELVAAVAAAERLLQPAPAGPAVVVREPRPGDFGWVIERHGAIYAEEYG